jgi:uncharacterized protein YbjT (DUF2867 family)
MYVIAGVTGHVGSVAAKELLAKQKPVKVIVRDAKKGEAWSKQGAQVAVGSLEDSAFLTQALNGADGCFVLIPPSFDVTDFFAYQKKIADCAAAAVTAANTPHVVMLSSIGADSAAGTDPNRGLHYFEEALRETKTTLTAVRAGYFQENIEGALAPAKQAGIFPNMLGPADHAFPMIATKDIGLFVADSLLNNPTRSENVDLQGPSYSIREAAQLLGKALGKEIKVVDIPAADRVDALKQAGSNDHIATVFAQMLEGYEKGIIRPTGDRLLHGKTELAEVVAALTSSE